MAARQQAPIPCSAAFTEPTEIESVDSPSWYNMSIMQPNYGWCDEPTDAMYNRFVYLPYPADAEHLWLNSTVYNILSVIGYNTNPIVPYAGSAIFFHVTPDFGPTAGCVAIPVEDMQWVLSRLQPDTQIEIQIV